ncbi:MAG: nitroreductase [Acidimicrobiales bacterium]
MDVTTAVDRRMSVREFLPTPIADDTIRELLDKASRAPSGGNVQPWRIYVVNGDSMDRFKALLVERKMEPASYEIYPSGLKEPYRTERFDLGMAMYDLLGIARDDKAGRGAQMLRNFDFFGAPAAIFCYVDRQMGPPQWSDLGMFLQTFMLLATEAGLDTCPQEAWVNWESTITEFCGVPEEERLFCGVALGHRDPEATVNTLRSRRLGVDDFARWV